MTRLDEIRERCEKAKAPDDHGTAGAGGVILRTSQPYSLDDLAARWATGTLAESLVACRIARSGFGVYMPPKRIRGKYEKRSHFVNEIDLVVQRNGQSLPVEVKSKNCHFTSTQSFPFDDVTLIRKDAWDQRSASARAKAFVIVSMNAGAMVATLANMGQWFVAEQYDRERGMHYKVYRTRKDKLIGWAAFIEWIQSMLAEKQETLF
jgi:hypothetical protein